MSLAGSSYLLFIVWRFFFVKLFVFSNIENLTHTHINKKGVGVLNIEIVTACSERLL